MIQTKLNRWNQWDELALLSGIAQFSQDGKSLVRVRKPGESNKELLERIREAFIYPGNSSKQGLINAISRDFDLERYSAIDKKSFILSNPIYAPRAGETKVYYESEDSWVELEPSVIPDALVVSGDISYSSATSGWILWQSNDGQYTQIVEIITDLPNETRIKIEYPYLRDDGQSFLTVDFDRNEADEFNYTYYKSENPNEANAVLFYLPEDFADIVGELSPTYAVISDILTRIYKLEWGQFEYDNGRWDGDKEAGEGNITTIFDASLPTGDTSTYFMGGIEYGDQLAMIGVDVTSSGWFPNIKPGTFYVDENTYYWFKEKDYVILNPAGEYYSAPWSSTGYLPGSGYLNVDTSMMILTDGSSIQNQNIGIPYHYPTGSGLERLHTDKWREIPWASGLMDNWSTPDADHKYWFDYVLGRVMYVEPYSGTLTLEFETNTNTEYINPSGFNIDPNMSANIDEKFIIADISGTLESPTVTIEYIGPPVATDRIPFKVNVFGDYGEPISGVPVNIGISYGSITTSYCLDNGVPVPLATPDSTVLTSWDGSAFYAVDVSGVTNYVSFSGVFSGTTSDQVIVYIGE